MLQLRIKQQGVNESIYTCNIYIYMRRTLDNLQITMVEAVYLCTIKKTVSKDMQNVLVDLLRKNAYMYIYLGWLLNRWRPLYSKYEDHLPKKYATYYRSRR